MLNIPSKNDKLRAQLIDSIRILAWKQYKVDNKSELKGLDLYEQFKSEWEQHDIQKMDIKKLEKFIIDLGYSSEELLTTRTEYYQAQKAYKNQEEPAPF